MATGYEKISKIKCKLRVPMTVAMLAEAMDCGPRTIFRHLNALEQENCGLHKFKKNGETFYVIQTEQKVDFNQKIVKQLERLKKTMNDTTPLDLKNRKLIDKSKGKWKTTTLGNEIVILIYYCRISQAEQALAGYAQMIRPDDIVGRFQYANFYMTIDILKKKINPSD